MRMSRTFFVGRVVLVALLLLLSAPSFVMAQGCTMDIAIDTEDVKLGQKEYSPYLNRGYPQQVFWGDTHTHTRPVLIYDRVLNLC